MKAEDQIPPELQDILNSELSRDEPLAWRAQPIAAHFAFQATPIVIFGILLTGAAVYWTDGVVSVLPQTGIWHEFSLFYVVGGLFISLGLAMLSAPYWMYRRAKRTAYVLTDRRAMIVLWRRYGRLTVRSFPLDRLAFVERKEKCDGSGDLVFSLEGCDPKGGDTNSGDIGFIAIRDVRSVQERLRRLRVCRP